MVDHLPNMHDDQIQSSVLPKQTKKKELDILDYLEMSVGKWGIALGH